MFYLITGLIILYFLLSLPGYYKRKKIKELKELNYINHNIVYSIIKNNFNVKESLINNFIESQLHQYFLSAHKNRLIINDKLEKDIKYNFNIFLKKSN